VIGRKADARWRKTESDPARFSTVQRAVLREAAARVRPGGRLLYVTCSTHPAENESVVESFLRADGNWSAAPISLERSDGVMRISDFALTIPGIDGADGFFYALLKRVI
jgi:16S rRNA (cytosine967-C5)-methyltransferase